MTHSIREITDKISALPEPMQQKVSDFVESMHGQVARQVLPPKHEPLLLSMQALAIDWNLPEKDKAWRRFQCWYCYCLCQAAGHLKFDPTYKSTTKRNGYANKLQT